MDISSIYVAAIINGVIQIIALLRQRKGNQKANRLLAALIGLLVWTLWTVIVDNVGLPAYLKLIDYSTWISPYFWGPTLYFYILIVTTNSNITFKTIVNHLSLGLGLFCIMVCMQLLDAIQISSSVIHQLFSQIHLLALYIQLSLYFLLCFQLLNDYEIKIKNHFSDIESMTLIWLRRLLIFFVVIIAIDMSLIVPAIIQQQYDDYLYYLLLAESIAIFAIGYYALINPHVLLATAKLDGSSKVKYTSSPLDESLSQQLAQKLSETMEALQPFKKNDLSLSDLADVIGVNPRLLSQVINEQYQKNFYDFVNQYRTQCAADMLLANVNVTITDIAYQAGFNNRASFNNAFKKYTGMTPTQYRRNKVHLENADTMQ